MARKMTVVGVGEKIIGIILVYLVPAIYLGRICPVFRFTAVRSTMIWDTGWALVGLGVVTNFGAAFQMLAAYAKGRLATGGFYAVTAHPMYTTHIFTTIPGLALLFNSWLILPGSLVMYLAARHFAKEEDVWLAAKFGKEYQEYRRRVWLKIL